MASQRDLAKYLDTNEHVIRDLERAGVFKRSGGRAGYDLDTCRVQYIRHLRALAKGADQDEPLDDDANMRRQQVVDTINVEKARQAAEMADKLAMENAVRRRELAPVSELRSAMTQVGSLIRTRLESLPAQLKRRIPHLRASELGIVKQEMARLSDELASIELSHEGRS